MRIAIVYSSRHGHVRTIAERLAAIAASRRIDCDVTDVRSAPDLEPYDSVVLAGSVHFGRHARVLRQFVQKRLGWLRRKPSAFISVSGAAGALEGGDEATRYISDFCRETGWTPFMTHSAAGALLYTRYGLLTKLIMKFASRTAGRKADTNSDVVYTNWVSLDDFMHRYLDAAVSA